MEAAESIQNLYSEAMVQELDKITNKVKESTDIAGYEEFLKDNLDLDTMDPVQSFMIRQYGIASPRAHQVVINALANKIKKAGKQAFSSRNLCTSKI